MTNIQAALMTKIERLEEEISDAVAAITSGNWEDMEAHCQELAMVMRQIAAYFDACNYRQ